MKNKIKVGILLLILVIIIIFVVYLLRSTIFYDYKGILRSSLDNYYQSGDISELNNINNLLNRYQNNKIRIGNIDTLINTKEKDWINKYNTSYDNNELLANNYDIITSRLNVLKDNLPHDLEARSNINGYIKLIDKLKISKEAYFEGNNYYQNNDYNNAYSFLSKVIEEDSYYNDVTKMIDICLESSINNITNKVKEMNNINEESTLDNKLDSYKKIFNYLIEERNNSTYDLMKSNTFVTLLKENEKALLNVYVDIAKSLGDNNEYEKAINIIDEGIKLLTEDKLDVVALTELKDAYKLMLPISLFDINPTSKDDDINLSLAIMDNNKHAYKQAITFKKTTKKQAVVYTINKGYKRIVFTVAAGENITEKNKDTVTLKIIGDNKVLKTLKITGKMAPNDIKLDIGDVDLLTFEFQSSSSSNDIGAIVGNPILEKY